MALFLTVLIVVIILVFLILFMSTRHLLKTIFFGFLIIIVLLGIFGFIIYNDFKELINNLPTRENKLVFVLDDKIIGGLTLNGLDFQDLGKNNVMIKSNELKELNNNYHKNLNLIKGDNYKLFIIDSKIIEESQIKDEEFVKNNNNLPLNGKEALTIIRQDESLNYYYEQYLPSKGVDKKEVLTLKNEIKKNKDMAVIFENDDNFRSFLLLIHSANLAKTNTKFLIDSFSDDKIKIHPETLGIKLVKEIPILISGFIE
ncbi:hypothetical protein HYX17_03355 [Candidatus Woesearchaeota archaeon]|nr:hypothetical protein [Candidatus Woesearchaeota archaeon]